MSGTQQFVYQKWPDKIFPIVNFVVSHDRHFGREGGGPPRLRRRTAILLLPWKRGGGSVAHPLENGGGAAGGRGVHGHLP